MSHNWLINNQIKLYRRVGKNNGKATEEVI